MPPKKAAATAATSTRAPSSRAKATKAAANKREASEEAEEPAPKRGKTARAAASSSEPSKATKGATKTSARKPATKAPAKTKSKASATAAEEEDVEMEDAPAPKASAKRKATEETVAPVAKKVRATKTLPVINEAPTEVLDVYVFGEGDSGELGLGTEKKAKGVKRPRINHLLDAEKVGVVQLAAGGMHAAALTHDNLIYTWGVNDQGACGRDTTWEGGLRDMDAADESDPEDGDDNGLNPKEATPTAIPSDSFPEDVKFVQLVAGDSATFALTADGHVYGWGTFRDNQGVLGFTKDVMIQKTPALVEGLKNIKQLACGANHILALDIHGSVFAWGTGQQNQLGRRVVERTRAAGLTPREFGLPKKQIKYISAGSDHSFAVDNKNNVWAWGLNNYGQCGISENAGGDDAIIPTPQKVASLDDYTMTCMKGGRHHSVGVSADGECLVWGRADGSQMGITISDIADDDLIKDERGRPRILKNPKQIPGITVKYAAAESDHSIAITTSGQAYSWGLSSTYQTGQGTDEDIEVATLIDNTAVRDKELNWAGAGGQYSILTTPAQGHKQKPNGIAKPSGSTATTSKQDKSTENKGKGKDTKKPSASSEAKGKKQANGTAAASKQAREEEQKLDGILDKLPKEAQEGIKETIRNGGRVVDKGDEIHVESAMDIKMTSNKFGEI